MDKITTYHIHPHIHRGWCLRKDRAKRATILGYKNERRISIVRRSIDILLGNSDGNTLIIHKKDGSIGRIISMSERFK